MLSLYFIAFHIKHTFTLNNVLMHSFSLGGYPTVGPEECIILPHVDPRRSRIIIILFCGRRINTEYLLSIYAWEL